MSQKLALSLWVVVAACQSDTIGRRESALDPGNSAAFVSQSVPATMVAGERYTVSVVMHNTGGTTWSAAGQYKLGAQDPQDNSRWGFGRVDLDDSTSVAPDELHDFAFDVTAPAMPGTYGFQWRMVQEAVEWFGDLTPVVDVVVTIGSPAYRAPDGVVFPQRTRKVTLRWSEVPGAAGYRVELEDVTDPAVEDFPGVTDTSLPVRVRAGHAYVWRVTAVDGGGGAGAPASSSFSILSGGPDKVDPTVDVRTPQDGAVIAGRVAVDVIATDAGDHRGVKRVTVRVDGHRRRELFLDDPPYLFLWDSRRVGDGPHTLFVTAEDARGNSATTAVGVSVQNGAELGAPCLAPGDGTVGDEVAMNAALFAAGPGGVLRLCPGAVYHLTDRVRFAADDQDLHTRGFPAGAGRAKLVVDGGALGWAVNGLHRSRIRLSNVEIDGKRGANPPIDGNALIEFGGDGQDQLVDHVKAYEPRAWSTLHLFEGEVGDPTVGCARGQVVDGEFGPSGHPEGEWADGISLACRDSRVTGNTIIDATDGAIVVFGAPGSRVEHNTIITATRQLLGGINMVDFDPFEGDYHGTVVTENVIDAQGAPIKVALAMGLPVWGCVFDDAHRNVGARVTNNLLLGAYMRYGFVANGVAEWTVLGNVSLATHSGTPESTCGFPVPAAPAPFLKDPHHADWTFQPEFVDGQVDSLLAVH